MSAIDPIAQEEHIKQLYNGGQIAAAINASQQLTVAHPDNAFGWKALSTLYIEQAQHDAAIVALQQAIRVSPNEFELHYNLGNEYLALHQPEAAITSFNHCIGINPHYVQAYSNLGNAQTDTRQFDAAIASYKRAIELQPDFVLAHYNLGNLFKKQHRYQEAVQSYCQALTLNPGFADAMGNMGAALKELGRMDEAIACYRQALALKPDLIEAYNNLGIAQNAQGQTEAAIISYHQALALNPDYAEAHNNLGNIFNEREQYELAETHYKRAIELSPQDAEAYNNLGGVLNSLGRHEQAIATFEHAISLSPEDPSIYSHLGVVLKEQGRYDEALSSYHKAIALKPDFAGAYNNMADVYKEQERFDEAIESLRKAIAFDPNLAEAYNNLGNTLQMQGQLEEAITSYRDGLTLKHNYKNTFNNLLFCVNYHPDYSSEELYAYYKEYEQHFARPLYKEWQTHPNDRDPQRRIKIGYVSPSFRFHSTRHFLEPLLSHHDHSHFEIYAYAQISHTDDVTARYQSYVDHWIPTRGMSDTALAERIRADGIDILVDVAGHTGDNRLLVFARKPAPVSLHWLDFGYTTGLSAIDYYLTDAPTTPPGSQAYFAEKLWQLPTPAYAYRTSEGMGEVGALPASRNGHINFGTLTRAVRLNYKLIRAWSEILKAVPGSHLIINSSNFKSAAMQERMAERFMAHGIARERLEIGSNSPPWDVLRNIDIGLDCYPHNSGTTLFETLYMGIPFVTLAGRPSVGTLGASVLHGIGHTEWIAESEEQYIAKAVALASDLPALAQLRSTLRAQMEQSPLMDEVGFTRAVEQAYRQMWQQWCES